MEQIVGEILSDLGDHHSSRSNIPDANAARTTDVSATPPPSGKLFADHVGYLLVSSGVGLLASPA
jgi:hypothetical protein